MLEIFIDPVENRQGMTASSRLRHIPAGLDNAAEYADAKHLQELFIVDIDCHINEPFASFANYLPEEYRKEYNDVKNLNAYEEYKKEYEVFTSNLSDRTVDPLRLKLLQFYKETYQYFPANQFDFGMEGRRKRSEIRDGLNFLAGMKPEQIVDIFITRMRDVGIKRSIIFPQVLLGVGNHPNYDFEVAVSNAYTDFIIDQYLDKHPELLSCVLLPANSPDSAAELIDRVGSVKGIVGAMVTAHRRTLAGDDSWLPMYEAARRKNLPICFHGAESRIPPFDQFKTLLAFHALTFPINIIFHLTSLLTQGIPERYPGLKFVFIEGGVTWIPWIMNRLDSVYMMHRKDAPSLKKLPSEYIKEFYYSSQPLEHPVKRSELEYAFNKFGAETQLMYASDYPHHDFDVPSVIYDLPFLTNQARKNILGENARRVFRIA